MASQIRYCEPRHFMASLNHELRAPLGGLGQKTPDGVGKMESKIIDTYATRSIRNVTDAAALAAEAAAPLPQAGGDVFQLVMFDFGMQENILSGWVRSRKMAEAICARVEDNPVGRLHFKARKIPKITFVLGADDPEMAEIRRVVTGAGHIALDAEVGGVRATPRTAYQIPREWVSDLCRGSMVVLIECGCEFPHPIVRKLGQSEWVIDHHHPSQPDASAPAELAVEASSLGQVAALLGIPLNDRQRAIAAADHNLPAAYAGEVPGVTSEMVAQVRADHLSTAPGADGDPKKVAAAVAEARAALDAAPTIEAPQSGVRFLSGLKAGYHLSSLAVTEAAVANGVAYITRVREGSRVKVVIGGAATPETIEWFLETYAPENGLNDGYGVPARGYAGGYVGEGVEFIYNLSQTELVHFIERLGTTLREACGFDHHDDRMVGELIAIESAVFAIRDAQTLLGARKIAAESAKRAVWLAQVTGICNSEEEVKKWVGDIAETSLSA